MHVFICKLYYERLNAFGVYNIGLLLNSIYIQIVFLDAINHNKFINNF